MKNEVRRAPSAQEPAHQEDTTTEFSAGTKQRVNRRTTVTVERETVSFLVRRPVLEGAVMEGDIVEGAVVAESAASDIARHAGAEGSPDAPDKSLPAMTPDEADRGSA